MTIKNLAPFFSLVVLLHVNSSCSVYQNDGRKHFESDILTSEKISARNLQLLFCEDSFTTNNTIKSIEKEISISPETRESIDMTLIEFNSLQSQFIVTRNDSTLHISSLNTPRSCSYEMTSYFSKQDCTDILRGLYDANH